MEATTVAVPQKPALWEDFVDILYAPRQVFERRDRFVLALVILTVVMAILGFASQNALSGVYEAEMVRGMEAGGRELTGEQLETARRMGGTISTVGILFAVPLGVFLVGLVLWAAGKLVGGVLTVGAAVMVVTYAQVPRALQQLVVLLQGMLLDPVTRFSELSIGPARFVDPEQLSPLVLQLLLRLDVFVLWSMVLIAIGLEVVGRVPRGRAIAATALVWLVGLIPAAIGAMVM